MSGTSTTLCPAGAAWHWKNEMHQDGVPVLRGGPRLDARGGVSNACIAKSHGRSHQRRYNTFLGRSTYRRGQRSNAGTQEESQNQWKHNAQQSCWKTISNHRRNKHCGSETSWNSRETHCTSETKSEILHERGGGAASLGWYKSHHRWRLAATACSVCEEYLSKSFLEGLRTCGKEHP